MAKCFCGCGRELKRRQFLKRRASERGEEISEVLKPLVATNDGADAFRWHLIEEGNAYVTAFQVMAHGGQLSRDAQDFMKEYEDWMPRAQRAVVPEAA
jgi:hypothetical protein